MMVMIGSRSTVAGERILFASDRGSGLEVYMMATAGEPPAAVATTSANGSVVSPSAAPNGRDVVYEVNGTIYLSPLVDPMGAPIALGGEQDPNVSPSYINTDRDYRVLYSYVNQDGLRHILMATVDISDNPLVLSDVVVMTTNPPFPQFGWQFNHMDPAFCGDNHFVWIREDSYETELCIQEFDANGPVGTPTCYFGGLGDPPDHHPSCASSSLFMTWVRGGPGYGDNSTDIWIMPCAGTDCDSEVAYKLYGTHWEETHPVWNPGNTWVAFAQKNQNADWEIMKLEWEVPGSEQLLTTNTEDDTAPTWSP